MLCFILCMRQALLFQCFFFFLHPCHNNTEIKHRVSRKLFPYIQRESAQMIDDPFPKIISENNNIHSSFSLPFLLQQEPQLYFSCRSNGKILKPRGGFFWWNVDCLNNTVQHRQWSHCKRLFSRDNYSSGDLLADGRRVYGFS